MLKDILVTLFFTFYDIQTRYHLSIVLQVRVGTIFVRGRVGGSRLFSIVFVYLGNAVGELSDVIKNLRQVFVVYILN